MIASALPGLPHFLYLAMALRPFPGASVLLSELSPALGPHSGCSSGLLCQEVGWVLQKEHHLQPLAGGGLGDSGSARQDKEAGTHRAEDAVRGAAQSGFEENCQL